MVPLVRTSHSLGEISAEVLLKYWLYRNVIFAVCIVACLYQYVVLLVS